MNPLNQSDELLDDSNALLGATRKRGRQVGSSNLDSNQHTSISLAFKRAGLDWRDNLAKAILADDYRRIALWVKLLPYLVSKNHKKVKKSKGRASVSALKALGELENNSRGDI